MKIAVEGCAHGSLDDIYATLQHLEKAERTKIDLLICCGDFQAVRNEEDLECLACPPKYRAMNSFWKYYSGAERAPYPTLFVGGNHEATNYLWELFYGGWAAPNIYFLGFAGVVRFGGVRIAGLSGIYQRYDYTQGHHERPPYSAQDIRSVYHVRDFDCHKLHRLQEPVDVFLSHDWPRGIAQFGNKERLLQRKAFLREEVERNTLGSPPGEKLLHHLKPTYWFSAHLHVKFSAAVPHPGGRVTKFLALDKCLPRRNFLQIIEFPDAAGELEFEYDEEWLAITRAYAPILPLTRRPAQYPEQEVQLAAHREFVKKRLSEWGSAKIPHNFVPTADAYNTQAAAGGGRRRVTPPQGVVRNPQTTALCRLLDIPFTLDRTSAAPVESAPPAPAPVLGEAAEDSGVPDDVDELESAAAANGSHENQRALGASLHQGDPDEIPLDDVDDDDEGC